MKTLQSDKCIFAFTPNMSPILTVTPPETVIFETIDAFGGQIRSAEDRLENLDFSRVNPATGPVFVDGAKPGDTLVVTIERIELPKQGAIVAGAGMGVLGAELEGHAAKILPISDGCVQFDDLLLPAAPMIGVIGVATATESFPTGSAHRHGGNMDTKEIGEGATIYLPVFRQGAMLAMGDVHALMGDGEVCVSACEVSAIVTVHVDVITGRQTRWPLVERPEGVYIIVSLPTVEEALHEATHAAVAMLSERRDISMNEAAMLASLAADIRISQLVDPYKTAKAFLPRAIVGEKPFP